MALLLLSSASPKQALQNIQPSFLFRLKLSSSEAKDQTAPPNAVFSQIFDDSSVLNIAREIRAALKCPDIVFPQIPANVNGLASGAMIDFLSKCIKKTSSISGEENKFIIVFFSLRRIDDIGTW